MYVVTVSLTARPGQADSLVAALRINAARSLAEEPGCHRFDICRAPEDTDEVFLYELYDDRAAFERHLASDHYATFAAQAENLVLAKAVRTFTRDDG